MEKTINFLARLLLAQIFLIAGIGKIGGYVGTQHYMEAMGVSGTLLPLVILVEIGGGLALIVGWQQRLAAVGLAVFTLLAAFIFHRHVGDQVQSIMFMKNLAITGGLLLLAVQDVRKTFSLDRRMQKA